VLRAEWSAVRPERAVELAAGVFLDGSTWTGRHVADTHEGQAREGADRSRRSAGEDGEYESALQAFRRAAELDGFREPTRLAVIECLLRPATGRAAINNTRSPRRR
jgi:hypothetical protein